MLDDDKELAALMMVALDEPDVRGCYAFTEAMVTYTDRPTKKSFKKWTLAFDELADINKKCIAPRPDEWPDENERLMQADTVHRDGQRRLCRHPKW
jgi:hypothetical protein